MPLFRRLMPDPFLLALVATMLLASLLPARGGFAGVVAAAATAAIMLLFFLHGAKLSRETVIGGLRHWRLHLTILGCTFLLFPALGLLLAGAVPGLLSAPLWTGVLFLCALPSTVQSSIAFTSIARGNVPAAIAAASASNLLGIALTPALMGLLAEAHDAPVALSNIGKILVQVLLPFLAGHLLRPWLAATVERHRRLIGYTDRSTVLLAVYSAFSAAVIDGIWTRVAPLMIANLLLVCGVILAIGLAATWGIGRLLGFAREDRIAILFCGSKKSLITGAPMARVLFPGPETGIILLPIMIFHQIQLMACALLAQRLSGRPDV